MNFLDDIQICMIYMIHDIHGSGDWIMRQSSLKMMAEKFVVFCATLYQWLVLRHLADLSSSYLLDVLTF